ncbi:PQQ-dependent sugar dehydrogenase [Emticicia sp. 21SJ11W-3]|uniref:PQQ-dependent sugar dehydrogenase n=1 Tax=Emticicia sp. 21SJ11W-3 TaxID=2916755 RepID=UPI00209D6F30|nr:PQQ-dependent sugar dehydrogenase [Emticicia sp. 21SJ11W-3]UTA68590.1 PQQ-dependent sugar dehydrogenase [Emticicia sp. 21SJ11W-3]
MKNEILTLMVVGLMGLSSCKNNSTEAPETTANGDSISTAASVETKDPNTNYKPAFAGQTRVAAVKTQTAYEGKVLTNDLKKPWGLAVLPDGRLLITEKEGTLRLASSSGTLSEPITGLPKVDADGQGGLLGISIDPAFTSNRMVYWVFSEPQTRGNLTAVGKGKLSADEKRIEGATTIYRATPAYDGDKHYGGRILFDKTGNLFVSTGERSDLETRPQAQQLNSALGKILYITKDGKPVSGNPFASDANNKPEIYSYGHRNVQGLALHPQTGELWENEFGPKGGDEVNLIKPGKNYGWPVITYGIEYNGNKIGGAIQQKEGLEQPVYYWDPVVSASGMTFYSGDAMPEWKNNLFLACLSATHIARLVIENNKVTGEERLLESEKQRFRDIAQGTDGALYAITDEGRLYRIFKK